MSLAENLDGWLGSDPQPPEDPWGDPAEVFWQSRPTLDHVATFARARRASPWAVLGVVLARVVAAVPPFVVLPPLTGGAASLNLFVGLVGPSGSGKGAAEAVAAEAVDTGDVVTATVGSGEGIAHLFAARTKDGVEQHTTAVLFTVAEIDTLTALADRRGATLLPELRKAWVGERLGFSYADPTKRLPIPAHRYRLALVAGIQPGRAAGLLDDRDGGTPQRFLWLPATDPYAPDVAPDEPAPWEWNRPTWSWADTRGRVVLPVCNAARELVDQARLARLRGDGDALDGHALLARLKVAAALALLEERAEVADEDWTLAGFVLDTSHATRNAVVDQQRRAELERNARQGAAEGQRRLVAEEIVEDAAVKRVARAISRRLRNAPDGMARRELRGALAGRDRQHFDAAVNRLIDAGQIKVAVVGRDALGHGGEGELYQLAEDSR